eukprot:TCONS_00020391-protein
MVTTFLMPAYQMEEEIEFGPHQQTNSVPNYTKNVLALGYMVKSFMDARKCAGLFVSINISFYISHSHTKLNMHYIPFTYWLKLTTCCHHLWPMKLLGTGRSTIKDTHVQMWSLTES